MTTITTSTTLKNPGTIHAASRQWATRPADQRFTSLLDLQARMSSLKGNSTAKVVANRALGIEPASDDVFADLHVVGQNGSPAQLTHWSFGQLASLAGAPPSYVRTLPAPIAADCLNYGLKFARETEDVGMLLTRDTPALEGTGGGTIIAPPALTTLRAATGPQYGRVWNADIADTLVDRFGDGRTGNFRVPGIFGQPVDVTRENTTIYGSDRDMFVFLADEERRIELPNRRNGNAGSLARGFYVWNSEVGAKSLGIAFFLFDYVCCNRIIWGVEQFSETVIRHSSGAPARWLGEVTPSIQAFTTASEQPILAAIEASREKKLDDVSKFLGQRFGKGLVGAIENAHRADEGRPIETVWDAATAVTAYARQVPHQDKRVELEREAGKLLALAA